MNDVSLLHDGIVEEIGMTIVSGRLAPGSALTLEKLQEQFGVSRTVARDSIHILESMRLVKAVRRHGILVQPASSWNVFDPKVIELKLRSPDRDSQLRTMSELRSGIEPLAAGLAADNATSEQRDRLQELAAAIRRAGESGDAVQMMAADVDYHTLILEASGNPMLQGLTEIVNAVLQGRAELGVLPCPPAESEMVLHEQIAGQIRDGDGVGAQLSSLALLREIRTNTLGLAPEA